jgi:hypothetical protein
MTDEIIAEPAAKQTKAEETPAQLIKVAEEERGGR